MIIVIIFLVLLFVIAPVTVFTKRLEMQSFNKKIMLEHKYKPINMALIYISGAILPIIYIGASVAYFTKIHIFFFVSIFIATAVMYYISKHIEEKTNKETATKSTAMIILFGIAIWVIPVMLYSYCSDSELSTEEKKQKWYCRQYWI